MVEMAVSEAEESGGCASILDCGELPKTVVGVDILNIRALTFWNLECCFCTPTGIIHLLESSEQDRFALHLYQARREYRHVCERALNAKDAFNSQSAAGVPTGEGRP